MFLQGFLVLMLSDHPSQEMLFYLCPCLVFLLFLVALEMLVCYHLMMAKEVLVVVEFSHAVLPDELYLAHLEHLLGA